ncbi:hypothetical protein P2318_21625 [Myxococcaceae bacterium GXIMD 01537]
MTRRMLCGAALVAALGTACWSIDRQGAGVYVSEPMVDIGSFAQVEAQSGQAWAFEPRTHSLFWRHQYVPVWVPACTSVFVNGEEATLNAVQPGSTVRLIYQLRRDGTGVAERIDVIAPETEWPSLDITL